MGKEPINKNKIIVISGAGLSVASGLPTFRDSDGLWRHYSIKEVASSQGWENHPQAVLDFYNERRHQAANAKPSNAHKAIAELEKKFEVVIITQNVDDLHERAGSTNVLHVHGELKKARSTVASETVVDIGNKEIQLGDLCERGGQLRPHIVWFGEQVLHYEEAILQIKTAGKILVVGTSLTVYPIAGILKKARHHAEKIIIAYEIEKRPHGYKLLRGDSEELVPHIVRRWLANVQR